MLYIYHTDVQIKGQYIKRVHLRYTNGKYGNTEQAQQLH